MTSMTHTYPYTVPALNCQNWFASGWRLLRLAPFKLFGFLLLCLAIEGVLQLLPAPYGMALSKYLIVILTAAFWPLLHRLSNDGTFSLGSAMTRPGWGKMLILALFLLLPTAVQLGTANLLLGKAGTDLILYSVMVPVSQFQLGLILASATPLTWLLVFAPAEVLLANKNTIPAIASSVRLVLLAWRPMLVIAMINGLVLFLVPYTLVLSALLFGPWLICVYYQAYRELSQYSKDDQ